VRSSEPALARQSDSLPRTRVREHCRAARAFGMLVRVCAPLSATPLFARIIVCRASVRMAAALVLTTAAGVRPVMANEEGETGAEVRTCLDWTARISPECPSKEQIASTVADVLGRPVFAGEPCTRIMRASIEHGSAQGPWVATMTVMSSDGLVLGQRQLMTHDTSCAALAGPMALVLALMVEDEKSYSALSVPSELRAPQREPRSARSIRSFGAVGVSWGLLPTVGLGPRFGFDVSVSPSISLRADGSAWLSTAPSFDGRGGRFWAWHAGAALCPELGTQLRSNVSACAGIQGGLVYGTGSGLDYNLSATRPIMFADAKLKGSVALAGPLALFAALGVGVPWLRPRFVYLEPPGSTHEVHRPSRLLLLGEVGLELRASPLRAPGAPP
jgi:hypothetical protein